MTMAEVDWDLLWGALGEALTVHLGAGRRHLLTEDVVRFATVVALTEQGVDAKRIAVEQPIAGVGRVDLVVDPPRGSVVEFKFPREPNETNAAYTMTFGEILRDLYRLAHVDTGGGWAVQFLRPKFLGYLQRRSEVAWTCTPGETLVLPAGLIHRLPKSARASIPEWATGEVRAHCHTAHKIEQDLLVIYRVA